MTLLMVGALTVMAGATIAPALPEMSKVFGAMPVNEGIADFVLRYPVFAFIIDPEFLSKLVLTITSFAIALSAPLAGLIIDRFGRKRLLLVCLLLYALAGTAGVYLTNIYAIIGSRVLLGLAVGGNMTANATLIADYFEGKERENFMAIQGAFMALGGVVFVILGGILAKVDWRGPFFIYLASLLVFVPVLMNIKETFDKDATTPAAAQLKYPKEIVWFIYLIGMISMITFYMIPVQIPFVLEGYPNVDTPKIGIAIALSTLFMAAGAAAYQKICTYLNYSYIYALAFTIQALGYVCISLSETYLQMIGSLLISGLGMGIMLPNASLWIMQLAPKSLRGRLLGGLTTFMFLGQFLSPFVSEPISNKISIPSTFLVIAGFMGLLVIGFLLGAKRLVRDLPSSAE